jgi:hypothetical protein
MIIAIPPSFFEPMPDDWLDAFYNGPIVSEADKPSRVAETSGTHGHGPRPAIARYPARTIW